MYDISDNIDMGELIPIVDVNLNGEKDIENMFRDGFSFIDEANECIYIPDDSGETNEVYDVMIAKLEVSEMDDIDDPVEWALANVPAPGSFAFNSMNLISVESAAKEIIARIEDFLLIR